MGSFSVYVCRIRMTTGPRKFLPSRGVVQLLGARFSTKLSLLWSLVWVFVPSAHLQSRVPSLPPPALRPITFCR